MKKLAYLLITFLVFASCNSEKNFSVKGTVADESLNGKEIYLNKYDELGVVSSDTVIIKNNKFQFKGTEENPVVYYIFTDDPTVAGDISLGVPLLIKPGKITVSIDGDRVIIGGNEENDDYQRFMDDQFILVDKMLALQNSTTENIMELSAEDPERIRIFGEYSELFDELRDITAAYILNNIDNPLGEEMFITSSDLLTLPEVEEALNNANESFRYNPAVVEILSGYKF